MQNPNLVIMLHRLGDLIMTLPLVMHLQKLEPNRPLLVVAEPVFYSALQDIVPQIDFIPPDAKLLQKFSYNKVLNISQRKEAALLSSTLKATTFIGQIQSKTHLTVEGFWQIYRTSLTQNSRHNLFHWADLHALDILNQSELEKIEYRPINNYNSNKSKKIGLFLGASSPLKRPEPQFFANLAQELTSLGHSPYFLGGESEIELGAIASKHYGSSNIDCTNKFNLRELTDFIKGLDLFITPDTGPMHLAASIGTQTLCLSLGNVNPYETSVVQPNHYTVQANISCSSCWDCYRNYECKNHFTPQKISAIAHSILENNDISIQKGLSIYKTSRKNGLAHLTPINTHANSIRHQLDIFWQAYFLAIATNSQSTFPLSQLSPQLSQNLLKQKARLLTSIFNSLKSNTRLEENFWLSFPPIIRILASFIQVYLENCSYSKHAYMQVLGYIESI